MINHPLIGRTLESADTGENLGVVAHIYGGNDDDYPWAVLVMDDGTIGSASLRPQSPFRVRMEPATTEPAPDAEDASLHRLLDRQDAPRHDADGRPMNVGDRIVALSDMVRYWQGRAQGLEGARILSAKQSNGPAMLARIAELEQQLAGVRVGAREASGPCTSGAFTLYDLSPLLEGDVCVRIQRTGMALHVRIPRADYLAAAGIRGDL